MGCDVNALGQLVPASGCAGERGTSCPRRGCATSRGPGERDRHAVQGRDPDRAGARLHRRPHPPRRVRVPRRPLPLRAPLEPLRRDRRAARLPRPLPRTAPARWSRTSSPPAARWARTATEGWPSFAGWPRDESQTHEGTYWKWIERAWRSGPPHHGQRPGREPRALRALPAKKNDCNEMTSAYKQAEDMHALQDYIDAQFGGPGKGFFRIVKSSGRGAQGDQRRQAGRRARGRGVRGARLRADQRTPEVRRRRRSTASSTSSTPLGVRSLFPVHKFDNALGGHRTSTAAPPGVLVNAGNKYATGQFWAADHCDARGPRQRAHQPDRAKRAAGSRCSARCVTSRCSPGSCRSIRPRRCATRRA